MYRPRTRSHARSFLRTQADDLPVAQSSASPGPSVSPPPVAWTPPPGPSAPSYPSYPSYPPPRKDNTLLIVIVIPVALVIIVIPVVVGLVLLAAWNPLLDGPTARPVVAFSPVNVSAVDARFDVVAVSEARPAGLYQVNLTVNGVEGTAVSMSAGANVFVGPTS